MSILLAKFAKISKKRINNLELFTLFLFYSFIIISFSPSNSIYLYVTPHSSKSLRDAILFSELAYLSDKYITSFIPD